MGKLHTVVFLIALVAVVSGRWAGKKKDFDTLLSDLVNEVEDEIVEDLAKPVKDALEKRVSDELAERLTLKSRDASSYYSKLFGTWDVTWSSGSTSKYTITPDGTFTVDSCSFDGMRVTSAQIQKSDTYKLPSSTWFLVKPIHRQNVWLYFRVDKNNELKLYWFATYGTSSFWGVSHYYGTGGEGTGVKTGSAPPASGPKFVESGTCDNPLSKEECKAWAEKEGHRFAAVNKPNYPVGCYVQYYRANNQWTKDVEKAFFNKGDANSPDCGTRGKRDCVCN